MSLVQTLVGSILLIVLFNFGLALRRGFVSLGSCPRGGLSWLHPMLLPALALAPTFPPRGWLGHYNGRFSLYAQKGSTILSSLWFWYARPLFWIADTEAFKAVTSDRQGFVKDIGAYVLVNIYGKSLVTTDGDEWRRHVAVAGPAFSESTNALAWTVTLRLMHEWFCEELEPHTDGSIDPDPVWTVDIVAKMTQLTLHLIASAGFGMRAPWSAFSYSAKDHSPSTDELPPFHVALHLAMANLPIQVLAPSFLYSLPIRIPWLSDRLSVSKYAFASMKTHMANIVSSVRNGENGSNSNLDVATGGDDISTDSSSDLLRRLVEANDAKDESGVRQKRALTDDELFSNIFTFLLAGHETSAHTLCFAILLLALYPDVQAKLREESYRIWPTSDDVRLSSYRNDYDRFEYTLAFFRETLRCFPSEPRLVKIATKDTTIMGTQFRHAPGTPIRQPDVSFDGAYTNVQFERDESSERPFSAFIPKGSIILMDIWAVQMNPLIWGSDAHVFRPERFIDTEEYKWPREGFLAFSSGVRGCLGQRFALAGGVCLLANLVRHYEITPAVDARRFASQEELKRAMLGYTQALTITPTMKYVKLRRTNKNV